MKQKFESILIDIYNKDRDQYLYPSDDFINDKEFQSDCLVYSLLSDSNTIKSEYGTNYWIPFTESEVNAKQAFESTFMTFVQPFREQVPAGK